MLLAYVFKCLKYEYEQCKKIANAMKCRWAKIAAWCNFHTKLLSQNNQITQLHRERDVQQI